MALNIQDRELVRGIGPATPMGELFRRYWHPVLLSGDLSERDGRPVRVKVLAEDLVAFRDSQGRVGLVEEACPHRGLPLSNGINANGRLTCIYHGWAFDVTGRCVDDLPDADQWRVKAYPTLESAEMIWAYLGPPEKQPPRPALILNRLPGEQVAATRTPVRQNYLRVIEEHIAVACQTARALDAGPGVTEPIENRGGGSITTHLPGLTIVTASGADGSALIVVPVEEWSSLQFTVAFNLDRALTPAEREAIADRGAEATPEQSRRRDGTGREDPRPADAIVAGLQQTLIARARALQAGADLPAEDSEGALSYLHA